MTDNTTTDDETRPWIAEALGLDIGTSWGVIADTARTVRHQLAQADEVAAGMGRSATVYARRYEKAADRLRKARRARAQVSDAHSEHQRAVCEALGGQLVPWPEAIRRVRKGIADRDGLRDEVRRLRGRVEALTQERDQAVAHDRQPYPTAWAYEQACKARTAHEERADRAEAALKDAREKHKTRLREADEQLRAMNQELERYADGSERPVLWSVYNRMHSRAATAEAKVARAQALADRMRHATVPPVRAWADKLTHVLGDDQPAETQPEPQPGRDTSRPFERRPCDQPRCIGAHRYMLWAKVYDCPGPGRRREQAASLGELEQQLGSAVHAYLAAASPLVASLARALGITKDGHQ